MARKQREAEPISLWLPQAPPGYVSLGCIACKGTPKIHYSSTLRCIRSDMVSGDQFSEESVYGHLVVIWVPLWSVVATRNLPKDSHSSLLIKVLQMVQKILSLMQKLVHFLLHALMTLVVLWFHYLMFL